MRLVLAIVFLTSSLLGVHARDMTDCEASSTLVMKIEMLRNTCSAFQVTDTGNAMFDRSASYLRKSCDSSDMDRAKRWLTRDIVAGDPKLRNLLKENRTAEFTAALCQAVADSMEGEPDGDGTAVVISRAR